MIPLTIDDQGCIKLEVLRRTGSGHRQFFFYFDIAKQDPIFEKLRGSDFANKPLYVFMEMKEDMDNAHPGLELQLEDLAVAILADYIGYRKGLWPSPYDQPVVYRVNGRSGMMEIDVPQGNSLVYDKVTVNAKELRYIKNLAEEGQKPEEISEGLVYFHGNEEPLHTQLQPMTIHRLRCIIRDRSEQCAIMEQPSWNLINTPYADSEKIEVCYHSPLSQ